MSKFLVMDRVSPTSVETFLQCQLKYYYNYFTKEEPIMNREPMDFGSSVHSALEFIAKQMMKGKSLTEPLCEKAYKVFLKECAKYKISKPSLLDEGQKIIMARIKKHNANYKIKSVEHWFNATTEGGTNIFGKGDIILDIAPNQGFIVDYKTSKVAKTQQEADEDLQLSFYDYMFNKQFPDYDHVWVGLEYLRLGTVISSRDEDERTKFGKYIDLIYEEMGDLTEANVKASTNKFCNWCGFKHLCSTYSDLLKKNFESNPISLMTEDDFVKEMEQISIIEKAVKLRKDELKSWAGAKMKDTLVDNLETKDKNICPIQKETISYDLKSLLPHIDIEDLPKFVKIDKKPFETYVEEEAPHLAMILQQISQSKFSEPYFKVRKKK